MDIKVTMQKQYATPGRAAMFAWKPLYTALLPIPRTDGRFILKANSKADLRFHVMRHLAHEGYPTKFALQFPEVTR